MWGYVLRRRDEKVVIVTGSTAGIGAGIAIRLGRDGARVVVSGRNQTAGAKVVEKIRESGGEAMFLPGDVTLQSEMEDLVERTISAYGRLDSLVASAGGVSQAATSAPEVQGIFHTLQMDAVADVISRATIAKLVPAQVAARRFVQQASGSILFITSEGGRVPTSGQTALAVYAGGLVMATKVLAKELARHQVRVNCIAVTLIADTLWGDQKIQTSMTDLERRRYARVTERAPLGLATAQHIGAVASFLLSDDAAYITGTTVSPTGGLTFS